MPSGKNSRKRRARELERFNTSIARFQGKENEHKCDISCKSAAVLFSNGMRTTMPEIQSYAFNMKPYELSPTGSINWGRCV
jgi:hypothetical protein